MTAEKMSPDIIKEVATLDPVAPYTTSIIGNPVLDPSAAYRSPRLKRTAIRKPKPIAPFKIIDVTLFEVSSRYN